MGHRFLPLLLLAIPACAAIVPRVSLDEMVDQSFSIVHGTVRDSWCAWDNAHQIIWTHYRVEIRESLKGGERGIVEISEPGGTVGGVGMGVSGAVPYAAGEEVVLFLYRTPVGYLRTVGHGQGKYTVGAAGRVRAAMEGHSLVDPAGRSLPRELAAVQALEGLPLDQLKLRVRSRLNRARPAGR